MCRSSSFPYPHKHLLISFSFVLLNNSHSNWNESGVRQWPVAKDLVASKSQPGALVTKGRHGQFFKLGEEEMQEYLREKTHGRS